MDQGRAEEAAGLVGRVLGKKVTAAELIASREADVQQGSLRELCRGVYLRRAVFVSIFYT